MLNAAYALYATGSLCFLFGTLLMWLEHAIWNL